MCLQFANFPGAYMDFFPKFSAKFVRTFFQICPVSRFFAHVRRFQLHKKRHLPMYNSTKKGIKWLHNQELKGADYYGNE